MTKTLVEIENVSLAFRQRNGLFRPPVLVPAVRNVSLAVQAGEVVGIVGESGSGKSTLAKIILRLLRADTGTIRIGGKHHDLLSGRAFAELVQPVFQDPYSSLNPKRTLAEIIETPLKIRGDVPAKKRRERAKELFSRVGLPMRMFNAYPNQISGGQRQRVAIARALMSRPRLLVCDEPTSALDVSVQAQILELFDELKSTFGLTYLFISHNLAVIERIADRVAVMYRGEVVEQGESAAFFAAPQHPYSRLLLRSALPPIPGRALPDVSRDFEQQA